MERKVKRRRKEKRRRIKKTKRIKKGRKERKARAKVVMMRFVLFYIVTRIIIMIISWFVYLTQNMCK